jgi:Sulfotransferase family
MRYRLMVGDEPRPVFVLGLQRSGTTWIANLLCEHPKIAGVQAAEHRGIHESIFFSHFARAYGDLRDDNAFGKFARHLSTSDYYLLTELPERWLEQQRPTSYADAFRRLMNEVAHRKQAACWIEKSPHHTLLCDALAQQFPDARFVCVIRSDVGLARSRLWAYGRTPQRYPARLLTLARAIAANALYSRVLRRFVRRCPRAILVAYEALAEDLEREMRRIATFLGLAFDDRLLRSQYGANSSFGSERARARALGQIDRAVVRLLAAVARITPLAWLGALERRRGRASELEWPAWCWTRMPRPADLPGRPVPDDARNESVGGPSLQPHG